MKKLFAGIILLAISGAAICWDSPTQINKDETYTGDISAKNSPVTIEGKLIGDVLSFGNNVKVDGTVSGDVVSLGGSADINGAVEGEIVSMGGTVEVNGNAGGDIAVVGGALKLGSAAKINGDIKLLGSSLDKSEGAVVLGSISRVEKSLTGLLTAARHKHVFREHRHRHSKNFFSRGIDFAQFIAGLIIFAGVFALLALFAPRQTDRMAQSVSTDFWKNLGLGIIISALFIPGIVILAVSILGILIIPVFVLAYFIAGVMGLAAFSMAVSARILRADNNYSVPAKTGIGFMLLNALLLAGNALCVFGGLGSGLGGLMIAINIVILCIAALCGLGAVFTTRFGARVN